MALEIQYGGVPVPKGWRLWGAEVGGKQNRPDPGRWFLEARYHHTGHWKLSFDYRPIDGKFPELWMPPFMWKYATEMESIEKILQLEVSAWAPRMLKVHPDNIQLFAKHVLEYGKAAKAKKKLLFGMAEGTGAKEHEIPATLLDEPILTDEAWTTKASNNVLMKQEDSFGSYAGHPETKYIVKKGFSWQYHSDPAEHYSPGDVVWKTEKTAAMISAMGDHLEPIMASDPFPEPYKHGKQVMPTYVIIPPGAKIAQVDIYAQGDHQLKFLGDEKKSLQPPVTVKAPLSIPAWSAKVMGAPLPQNPLLFYRDAHGTHSDLTVMLVGLVILPPHGQVHAGLAIKATIGVYWRGQFMGEVSHEASVSEWPMKIRIDHAQISMKHHDLVKFDFYVKMGKWSWIWHNEFGVKDPAKLTAPFQIDTNNQMFKP